jgi:hypothetical protein
MLSEAGISFASHLQPLSRLRERVAEQSKVAKPGEGSAASVADMAVQSVIASEAKQSSLRARQEEERSIKNGRPKDWIASGLARSSLRSSQ